MLTLWLTVASSAASIPPPPSFEIVPVTTERRIEELCFPSGLRVTVIEDDRAPVVGITAVVSRGASQDPPGKAGAAHLLEHLWFRAQPEGKASVTDRLHAEGAVYNGYTMLDAAVYLTVVSRAGLPQVLRLYGALVTDPLVGIGETELANERDLVVSESQRSAIDWFEILRALPDGIFPEGHPYASLAPTTSDTLRAVTFEDLHAIAASAYRPDLVSLQIAGNTTPDEVQAQIEATFPEGALWNGPDGKLSRAAKCEAHPLPGGEAPPPGKQAEPIVQVEADVDHPLLVVAWRLPAAYGGQGNLLGAVTAHLDLVDDYTLAGDMRKPYCSVFDGLQASIAWCIVQLQEGESALKWKRLFSEVLHSTQSYDITDYTVSPLQMLMEADIVDSLETLSGLDDEHALAWALNDHFTGETDYYGRAVAAVSEISAHEIERFEEKWLAQDAMWAVHVLPRGSAAIDEGTETDEDATEPDESRVSSTTVDPPTSSGHGALLRNATDLDVLASLQTRDPDPIVLPTSNAKVLHLETGLTVVIVPYGNVAVVRTALVFGGAGVADEPAPGAGALRSWMTFRENGRLGEGHRRTASRIGGTWFEWSGVHARATVLRASSGNLDGALYLVRSHTENTVLVLSSSWRQTVRDRVSQAIDAQAGNVQQWERSLRLVPLLGDRTLAWSKLEQTWTGVSRAHPAQLKTWERGTVRPDTATLYIVGRVDPTEAETLVHSYFDSWEGGGKPWTGPVAPALPVPPPRTIQVLDDATEDDAVVVASCRAAAGTRAARDVARGTLDWISWQALRLAPELAAYDPSAGVETDETSFAVYTIRVRVRADQAGRAVRSVLDVFREASAGDDPRVVSFVRGDLRRREQVRWLTTSDILAGLITTSGPTGDLTTVPAYFQELAGADPRTALGGCVGHEVVTVRGPAAAIEGSLRASDTAFSRTDVAAYANAVRRRTVH